MRVRVILFGLTILLCAFLVPHEDVLTNVLSKFKSYIEKRLAEKVYLHFDKPLYAAGEDMWFSCYLVNAATHQPDSLSKVIYVELFNPQKKLSQKLILHATEGSSHGDFHLADTLPPGNYTIRAYTNFMKNISEDFFFVKEIAVLSSTMNDTIPTKIPSSVDVQFFPEGGSMLVGVENRICFKAIDETGKGLFVEGQIEDESGNVFARFKVEHAGMGMFNITPLPGKKYIARIKAPEKTIPLPEAELSGYLLRVTDMGKVIKILVYHKQETPAPSTIFLVGQTRGIVCFATKTSMPGSTTIANIPKTSFASGITQITLFDESGTPLCERLIFINHQSEMKVIVNPDKPVYDKRGEVSLNFNVTSSDGSPVSGRFSLSVYDESVIHNIGQYPSSIVDNLLLTSDLRGTIEEPGYYLKDTLPLTKYHADLVMMSHGWRRFTWKNILGGTREKVVYRPESGIPISGTVTSTNLKKPAINSGVKIFTPMGDVVVLKTDSAGRFYYDEFIFYDTIRLAIQTDNAKGKQSQFGFTLKEFYVPQPLLYNPSERIITDADAFLNQNDIRNKLIEGYKMGKDAILLKDVVIKGQKIDQTNNNDHFNLYGTPDATIKLSDSKVPYQSVLSALWGRVAGVVVNGAPGNETVQIRGTFGPGSAADDSQTPLYLLDGIPTDITFIQTLPVAMVESIDVLKNAGAAGIYGSRGNGGVIAVYTKKGTILPSMSSGMHHVAYVGFSKAREFYAPKYYPGTEQNLQDVRNTLYWNPMVKTDSTGKAKVSFFTSDIASDYKVVVEGISSYGAPGAGYAHLKVKK